MTAASAVKALLRPVLGPLVRRVRLTRRMRALADRVAGVDDHGVLFDAVMAVPDFAPIQRRAEFLALMARAAEPPPRLVCEVGSYLGGTGFLLARVSAPDATIILVDDQFALSRQAALRRMARPGQRVRTLRGDSHTAAMRARVVAAAGGRPLDVLFIDGDHRYEGVAADFALYAPLVRPGGLIAFHDIVPDRRARTGAATTSDAGGVPRFWAELREGHGADVHEAVDDPAQDACGIGMLYWRP